jgi:ketosteroid isomerase-like protein
MSKENAELIRRAYQAHASGDLDGMRSSLTRTWDGPIWIRP